MFLRPYGSKRLLASPSDCVLKNKLSCLKNNMLLCYCVFKKSYYVNRKTCYYVIVSKKLSYHV